MAELLTIKPDVVVNIDHVVRVRLFKPGDTPPIFDRTWDLLPRACLSDNKLTVHALVIDLSTGADILIVDHQAECIFEWLTRASAGF